MPKKKPDPFLIDDENPEWTEEDFRLAQPAREVLRPSFFTEMKKLGEQRRKQLAKQGRKPPGRPPLASPKVVFSLRLPADLVQALRASGPGYRARAEKALRAAVAKKRSTASNKKRA